jgi:hypothetical protein
MKAFISWSGSMSYRVACALRDWLPCVLQAVKPFISTDDIAKGSRWSDELAKELQSTDFGIICITPFNLSASWLSFEAGGLSKTLESSRVVPLLFGVEAKDVTGPLAQFQSAQPDREGILGLVHSLNDKLEPGARIADDVIHRIFEKWWPDLEQALGTIPVDQEDSTESGIDWLYRPGDLVRQEMNAGVRAIWVITPSPYLDLQRTCVKNMIQKNIDRGVRYTFIMPESDECVWAADQLRQIFSGHLAQLTVERIEHDTFDSLAVTHYLVLNPDRELDLEVLLELPIAQRDYWVKVSGKAAFGFADRFRRMVKESHEHQASAVGMPIPNVLPAPEMPTSGAAS